ncbi:ATP-dependent helicase [Accumulibacter sp.]|uniref:ATP-dependent helicase n=1 Tax=Accumulibacter sp. TaxID=2053492 RepID=UPI001AC38920|nr:ATP-dependent helicase [Accumulibacter sp.]MBN8454107.1 ATP-dependent helicase [Accumulibacter sp.]MBO3711107.1 ATP-dependent helicase [Accumulibacter sp.]
MARIIPDGWRELAVTGGAQREIETLAILADGLPDAYSVYHAVHWTATEGRHAIFGEIDFAVVNLAGDILLIEQKSGFLGETAAGLVKQYPGRSKSVPVQISRMVGNLRGKLASRADIPSVHTDALLYCPDYTVRNPETAGLARERIVDASARERLCRIIQELLPAQAKTPATPKIHAFLRDLIQLDTDVSALMGHARNLVTRVSGGLAQWARRLEFEPFRLRITGTAGSGKTQLALAEYRATIEAGKRPLYVCFNRPLADHFNRIAPPGGLACTYHQLCDQRLRDAGETPDFTAPDAFERLQQRAAALPVGAAFVFDTIIVDEGQDISETWRDSIFRHARADARLLWLEDPMQNLYGRPPTPLPGWVTLRSQSNYRSPRPVVELLRRLLPDEPAIEAASPIAADEIECLDYADTAGLLARVKEAIRICYSAGFRKHDLAIVSYHGRGRSQLMALDRLGQTSLRHFTGDYDLFGQPVYTDGDVLVESVYRFKGQSAPAVILAEIDFEALDDRAVRKLFVGATRSSMKLILVVHERSAARLLERMG